MAASANQIEGKSDLFRLTMAAARLTNQCLRETQRALAAARAERNIGAMILETRRLRDLKENADAETAILGASRPGMWN